VSIADAGDVGRRRNDDDATTAAAAADVPIEPNAARREDTLEGKGVAPSMPRSDEDDGALAESRTTLRVRAAGDATNAAAGATRRARRKDFIVVCLLLCLRGGFLMSASHVRVRS